jgi:hypothetical protein
MTPWLIVVAVVSLVELAAQQPRGASAGPPALQTQRPETPPGWADTKRKARDLTREDKHREAVALYERWVAAHPDFPEGHFRLGEAKESLAVALVVSGAPNQDAERIRHFEAAASHMRRALDLAGPAAPFLMMRALIDIHGVVGLGRPAEYARLVRAGVTRFPAEPQAHGYLLALIAAKGEPIDAAARAARAAIPEGPDGRVALAGALVAQVATRGSLTRGLAPTLLPEASRLVDEALQVKPDHAAALRLRANILAVHATASRLPAADALGVGGALRAIAVAQATYSLACGDGFYALTLAALAKPRPGHPSGFLAEDLVPAKGTSVIEKYRYRIEMRASPSPRSAPNCHGVPAGGSAETFSVEARPLDGVQGPAFRIATDGQLTEIK